MERQKLQPHDDHPNMKQADSSPRFDVVLEIAVAWAD